MVCAPSFFKPGEKKNDATKAVWDQLDDEPVPGQDSVVISAVDCNKCAL